MKELPNVFPADVNVKEVRPAIVFDDPVDRVMAEIRVIEPKKFVFVLLVKVGVLVDPVKFIPPVLGMSQVTVFEAAEKELASNIAVS